MKKCYLAIDIGASGGRHMVGWAEAGRICTKEVYRFRNGMESRDGHLCWDGEGLLRHVVAGLAAAGEQGFAPASVGIDTWGVDYVLLDEKDQLLGDFIAYRDSRTQGEEMRLSQTLPFARHYALAGIAYQPFNTVYQLMADFRDHPEYRDQARDFLLIPEYLNFRLTGRKAHEWTILSTSGLCDARERTWNEEVIGAAGLPGQLFGTPICPPGTDLGPVTAEIAGKIGYTPHVVLPAAHDTGSAFMAVPARDEQAVFLSSGTWSLLGAELPCPVTGKEALEAGFTNEGGYGGAVRFLKNIMGMWMLQCIRRETGERYSYEEMARMAGESAYPAWIDAKDKRFLAPESMLEEVRAALREQGAPEAETIADLIRAVTVGLAVCYRDAIEEMQAITGRTFTAIHIVGGGSQNGVLNRMTADHARLPVYAGPTEGTALGNLGAQMIAGGEFEDLQQFRKAVHESCQVTVFDPEEK